MWIYYRLIESFPNVGLIELRECAKILGYKQGWAWFKWQELQQPQLQSA
jgi:predicted RNase H-like nuclease